MTIDGGYRTSQVGGDFLAHLGMAETRYLSQMAAGYAQAFKAVEADLDKLAARVAAGEQGISFDLQERRMKSLLGEYSRAIGTFKEDALATVHYSQQGALTDAQNYMPEKLPSYMGRAPTGVSAASVMGAREWATVNRAAYEACSSMFRSTESPLRATLSQLGDDTMRAVRSELQKGILLGRNPLKIASRIKAATSNIALGRARVIARTEFHRAYRQANREQYDKSDVVKGWVWKANLDGGTCPVCVAMGGTQHDTREILDGHPSCRCTMVPLTKSWGELGFPTGPWDVPEALRVPSGPEWFSRNVSNAQARRMLGPSRFNAMVDRLKTGEPLGSIMQSWVTQKSNALWGPMKTLAPVNQARIPKPPPRQPTAPTGQRPFEQEARAVMDHADRLASDLIVGKDTRSGGGFHISNLLHDAYATWAGISGKSVARAAADVEAIMRQTLAKGTLATRRSMRTLERMLDDPQHRFKSQFETGNSAGCLDPKYRAKVESEMFGYPETLNPRLRPIYGYMEGVGGYGATSYGDIRFTLSEDLRYRTTASWGDSLGSDFTPTSVLNPRAASWNPANRTYSPMKAGVGPESYLELQFHGGLSLDDVVAIDFTRGAAPSAAIRTQLSNLGWVAQDAGHMQWRRAR